MNFIKIDQSVWCSPRYPFRSLLFFRIFTPVWRRLYCVNGKHIQLVQSYKSQNLASNWCAVCNAELSRYIYYRVYHVESKVDDFKRDVCAVNYLHATSLLSHQYAPENLVVIEGDYCIGMIYRHWRDSVDDLVSSMPEHLRQAWPVARWL